jgi:hypothetical protein
VAEGNASRRGLSEWSAQRRQEERAMGCRRLVGIDLGIASDHTVRVLAEDGREVCRRRCQPSVESLTAIEEAALAGAEDGTRLEVVFEPTGPAWLPIAVFFTVQPGFDVIQWPGVSDLGADLGGRG